MKGIYAAIVVLMLAAALPTAAARASTATVMAYPTQNVSDIIINDTVLAVLHYPNGSFLSYVLQGRNYSISYSAFVSGPAKPLLELQEALREYDPNITVINVSVVMTKSLYANSTTLVFRRSSVMSVWVSGIFNRTASGVVGDFNWKAFKLDKPLYFSFGENAQGDQNFQGNEEDVNFFGGDFLNGLGLPIDLGDIMPELATVNFSAFNTPLSQWTRHYNPSTNMTYFTKSVPTQVLYSASLTANGQTFSISVVADPAYTIGVQGYAVAQGNSVVVSASPPASYSQYALPVAVAAVAVGAAYALYRRRK